MVSWPDLIFSPINLWSLPKQQKDYNMIPIALPHKNDYSPICPNNDFEILEEYIELFIKPLLRAAGFGEASLDKYFVKEEPLSFVD